MIPRYRFATLDDKASFQDNIATLYEKHREIVSSAPGHIRSRFHSALYDFFDAFHVEDDEGGAQNGTLTSQMVGRSPLHLNEALSTGQDELSVLISLADGNTTPTIIALMELQKQCSSMAPSEKKA